MPPSPKNRWGKKVTGVTMQMVVPGCVPRRSRAAAVIIAGVSFVLCGAGCEVCAGEAGNVRIRLAGDAKPYIRCTQPAIGGKSWRQCHYDVVFVRIPA